MNEIKFVYNGKEQIFSHDDLSTGDPFDPSSMLRAMERLPSLFAFYANVLREAKMEQVRMGESMTAAKAVLAHVISEGLQVETRKKPAAAEVDRQLLRKLDMVLKAREEAKDTKTRKPFLPEVERYAKLVEDQAKWTESVDKMSVIVEAIRLRCSLIRSQSGLLESMLQQNLIQPPRMESGDRIGGPKDDGGL